MFIRTKKYRVYIQVFILGILIPFLGMGITPISYAQSVANLPAPGIMVTPGLVYSPAIIKGISINPENPLKFNFIVDKGSSHLSGDSFNDEAIVNDHVIMYQL